MTEATDLAGGCECPSEAGSASCELRLPRETARACPTCGERGKAVDTGTVKALLAVPLTEIADADYLFCRTAACPTVYFAADGESRFAEESLRERVHQKHPEDDDVFVCYCFRHTPGTIKADLDRTGRTDVIEAVTAGIRAGKCACEIRNPQGSCCLGNVRAVVDRLTAAMRTTES
jgi:hypothetical protein